MATGTTIEGSRVEHRGLLYWMERVLKELENVRTAPDADAVHDLRVAIRRCRSVGAVMQEVDPDPAWPEMRKLGRKLFRQLGELRDAQVLEDWVKQLGSEADPVRQRVLASLEAQERELREAALRVEAKFEQRAWKKLERHLQMRARLVPPDGAAAECLALERLDAAKELHVRAMRTEKPRAWHELRIGVKRFRYTVESLLPTRHESWSEDLKRLQDLLGEVHDLDVLSTTINEAAAEESEEVRAAWAERITSERFQRTETYRQLTLGKTSLLQAWRQGLPHGQRLEEAAMARILATARALDGNTRRTSQVARLALRLFDGIVRLHATSAFDSKELRKLMRAAARLQGIGTGLEGKSPEKAARDYLQEMVVPAGWTDSEWKLLANIVRYHRGAQPQQKHKGFAKLTQDEQKTVCALAGILRLARALRKCGVVSTVGMRMEKSLEAIIVHIPGLVESEAAAARLAAGKYLLENSLERPLILKSAPALPKVVELRRAEEIPPASEAATG
ncbi:MAG TPA: CHAD domain-containing protein [Candidatus Limnocylindrales bacterium]|nr:CHAD domain-containing protein [Candidatus Limnocylindrales bacterium]